MAKYLTRFGMTAIREKIARLEGKRDQALQSAGEAAQNDPNSYHDNFEYEENMRQQEMFSRRIRGLWETMQGATPAPDPADDDRVAIGHYVTVQHRDDGDDGDEEHYVLCGEGEGGLFENACSISSPVGQLLLGMAKGESKSATVAGRSLAVMVVAIRAARPGDFQVTGAA
jgi:transcription elongation GreA/GreB family factor